MKVFEDIPYANNQTLDIYVADNSVGTIIYFHGGGFVSGTTASFRELAKDFAEHGYSMVLANYRKYPDAHYPDFLDDAVASIKFVKDNMEKYGLNKNLYISGQSAGAWMALLICFNRDLLAKIDMKESDFSGWIIDSAQTTSHFNVIEKELGIDSRLQRIDKFAPLYYIDAETKFNKMLLLCYEKDMPCRVEQNKLMIKSLEQFNPNVDITYKTLHGAHCHGSSTKDEDGRYEFNKVALDWLNR